MYSMIRNKIATILKRNYIFALRRDRQKKKNRSLAERTSASRGKRTYFSEYLCVRHILLILVGHGVAQSYIGVVVHLVHTVQPPVDSTENE